MRSEIGVVERISIYSLDEKLNFFLSEVVNWFKNERVSKGYLVELIEYVEINIFGYEIFD